MEEINTTENKTEENAFIQPHAPQQTTQSKRFLIWIVAAVIIILVAGGGYLFFALNKNNSTTIPTLSEPSLNDTATISPSLHPINTAPNPHVYILEITEETDSSDGILFAEVTKKFYEKYPDKYDFLAAFPSFPPKNESTSYGGLQAQVENDVRGICKPLIKRDDNHWKSKKLQSFQLYPYSENNYMEFLNNPNKGTALLLEETSHNWLTSVGKLHSSFPPGNPPDGMNITCLQNEIPLLLEDDAHWSYGLQSPAGSFGVMREAKPWIDNGDGTYSYDFSVEDKPRKFHLFDLYLMGFMDKSDITDKFLLLYDIDNTNRTELPPPIGFESKSIVKPGLVTTKAKAQYITIEDILKITGEERNPSTKASQKDFTIAYIILAKKGQKPPEVLIDAINAAANVFPDAWAYATDNRSTMNK